MTDWIPFGEGSYLVERAFLMTRNHTTVILEDSVIEVRIDPRGKRHMDGHGLVYNLLVVRLLEEHDDLDLLLDLGDGFKYLLKDPILQAGKVFSPETKSMIRFAPSRPLEPISESQFEEISSLMTVIES